MARRRETQWAAVAGEFAFEKDRIRFHGGPVSYGEELGVAVGTAMSDQWFGGGSASAAITFDDVDNRSACDLVLFRNPATGAFLSAGISNEVHFWIHHFDKGWTAHAAAGGPNMLKPGRTYQVQARVRGSLVTLVVNGVEVCSANLPFPLPRSQAGIWCRGNHDIFVTDFQTTSEPPRAFVVMQFTSPYNELYREVVKPVCEEMGVDVRRADETYGPGLIIADVVKQIDEAKFVIAEITPKNPNVYYEVGYAHARGKPTVLIADRELEKLPFDLSPFRTLFYENSIEGKRRIEDGLRHHLNALLDPSEGAAV